MRGYNLKLAKQLLTIHCVRVHQGFGGKVGMVYGKKGREIYHLIKIIQAYFLPLTKLNRNILGRKVFYKSKYPVGSSAT